MSVDFIIDNWDKIMVILFAGLSTIFAGLSFLVLYLEFRRNNPKIKVKLNRSIAFFNDENIDFMTCKIVNKGRRPIIIKSFHFPLSDGTSLFFNPNNSKSFF